VGNVVRVLGHERRIKGETMGIKCLECRSEQEPVKDAIVSDLRLECRQLKKDVEKYRRWLGMSEEEDPIIKILRGLSSDGLEMAEWSGVRVDYHLYKLRSEIVAFCKKENI